MANVDRLKSLIFIGKNQFASAEKPNVPPITGTIMLTRELLEELLKQDFHPEYNTTKVEINLYPVEGQKGNYKGKVGLPYKKPNAPVTINEEDIAF